jgi:hypothetical protein
VNNKIANGLQRRLRIDDSAPWNPGDEQETSSGNKTSMGQRFFAPPQQNAVAAITLLDTLLKEDALNQHHGQHLEPDEDHDRCLGSSQLRKHPHADWQPSSPSLISRLSPTKPQHRRRGIQSQEQGSR